MLLTIGGDVGVNARTSLEHIIATGNVALEFAGESSATLTASDVLSLTVPATDASREVTLCNSCGMEFDFATEIVQARRSARFAI